MELTSGIQGNHEVHIAVIPSNVSPENPDDYSLQIPTLGNIYRVFSTLPEDKISRFLLRITYQEEDYLKAGFKEDTLRIYSYDPDTLKWVELEGGVDTELKFITGISDGFGYFTISGQGADPNTGEIVLSPGWNCVSTAKGLVPGLDNASIFANVPTAGHSLMRYNSSTGWASVKSSDLINPLEGLWIYAAVHTIVPVQFNPNPEHVPPTIRLGSGWNSIGFFGTIPISARDTFLSVQNLWRYCVGYDESLQKYDLIIENGGSGNSSDQRMMKPYHGYWLYMTGEGEFTGISAI